jgi:tetratricopeptide (TPR) repeat protein
MQPDWQRIRAVFDRAIELPPDERSAFLDEACEDGDVRAELDSLLAAAAAEGPLDSLAPRLASVRDVLAETPPERAGPYLVDAPIGRGGMGVVYRAHDPRLERHVAIKFLPASMQTGTRDADRLTAEARTASALDHPGICTIYDIGTLDDGRLFIAMAYYPRGTLVDRLRGGALPIDDIVSIGRQIADALDCAHAAGIVHRDVKPANIAFGERGEVKVLDFGVAVLEQENAAAGSTVGTPSYMSPEQARGEAVDARSDVWSLGVMLYEMLTGRKPFTGESPAATLELISRHTPDDVAALRPGVPPQLAGVVRRAMAKDPAERFSSAAELRDALAVALVPARAATFSRARVVAAAAGVVLALSAVGALALRSGAEPGTPGLSGNAALDEQFMRGRQRLYEDTPESIEAAALILGNLIAEDSTHALGRAWLAMAYATSVAPANSRQMQWEWLDSAHAHADAALRLAPRLPDAHAALGMIERTRTSYDEALEHHRRALSHAPDFPLSVLETGLIHSYLGDRAQAVRWLERGLELDPEARAARRRLTIIYRTYRMYDEARRHIRQGRQIAADDAGLIWESVMIELEGGDTAIARADFDLYLQLVTPGERDRMRAWFEFLRGDNRAAADYIDRLDLVRAPWWDLRVFGLIYLDLGRRDAGTAMLRRALRGIDAELGARNWPRGGDEFQKAFVYAALGDEQRALESLRRFRDAGGVATLWQFRHDAAWGALHGNPEFVEIMRTTEERYLEQRSIIADELRRIRDG